MTEEALTAQMTEKKWHIDLRGWTTMKPILAWQQAALTGDLNTLITSMRAVIDEWGFAGDPADAAAYENLTPAQWTQAVRKVNDAIAALFPATAD